MMRSMYSAVSSLKAHQLKMDVIGNNIANVNTVGFKGSRVAFQEVFSQTLRGAGRPQEDGRGGTNPQQVGLGTGVGSMDTFHMRGSVESTGYNTDLMINGDGFFIVSDTESGLNRSYTRAGNFCVDEGGNLLTSDGFYVLGYRYEDDKIVEDLKGLKISKSETAPPKATTEAKFEGNLNSDLIPVASDDGDNGNGEEGDEKDRIYRTIMNVYDSLGNAHSVELQFEGTNGTDGNDEGRGFKVTVIRVDGVDESEEDGSEEDDNGNGFGINSNGVTLTFDETGKLDSKEQSATLKITSDKILNGAAELKIELDFSKLTSYSAPSDAAALDINGHPSGKLEDFTISPTGEVEATFSNGMVRILGQLRLANFRNPAGLLKTGSNMYRETANSGEAMYGYPAAGGFANLQPGSLEMSNVDLSREFTDMITTQRGFQANSRVITASDEMLQELVNMKR